MKLHNMLPFRRSLWMAIGVMSVLVRADDLSQQYCSTENTGSALFQDVNIYQSNGACFDKCNGQYAFAVVQWQSCWCSNYIPAVTSSVSNCNQNCPGYPSEQCGNADTGYYGYIALSNAPSGTAGAVSSSSPASTSSPSSSATSSAASSSTSSEDPETSYTTSPTTSAESSSSVESSATPVTSIIVKTISNAVVTQTVTSTPIVAPGFKPDTVQFQRQNSLGAGAIAGIAIGVIAGIALLALAGFLLWRRRRSAGDAENTTSDAAGSKRTPSRNVSVLSKAGLLARNQTSMGEREHDEPYFNTATGSNSVRHSMMFSGADGVETSSPLDSSHSHGSGSGRYSKPMVYDQRLNPSALFANADANGSRVSMQDQQDYSRPLGVMNPDPRASFESRISHA